MDLGHGNVTRLVNFNFRAHASKRQLKANCTIRGISIERPLEDICGISGS